MSNSINCWAYDADIHCNDCKHTRFGDDDYAKDSEDNTITPIFAWDEQEANASCGTCHEYIHDQPATCDCGKQCTGLSVICNDCWERL